MRLYAFLIVVSRMIVRILWRPRYMDTGNIPATGPVVLCSNHFHWADPVLVACACQRPLHYMGKEELFRIPVLGRVIRAIGMFPIKRGAVDRRSIRTALAYLGQGEVLGIFPEGTRSKTGDLQAFLNGAAYFAVKSGATIVPIGISGSYRLFTPLTVKVGKPIHTSDYDNGSSGTVHLNELSKIMMDQIVSLRDGD